MRSTAGILFSLMLSIAGAASAQGQSSTTKSQLQPENSRRTHFNTHPMPPKVKPRDPMLVAAAYALPLRHERYTWKITGKNPQGKVRFTDAVPVYFVDVYHRHEIGKIAIGTEIKLDKVTHFRGVLHYAVPFKSQELDDIERVGWKGLAWVSGETVEATAFKPSDQ